VCIRGALLAGAGHARMNTLAYAAWRWGEAKMDAARLEAYRKGWRMRRAEEDQAEHERWQLAMVSARQVAERLRCRWGASEVYLFGSVARRARGQGWVGVDADIDIAVSGVDPVRYFAVLADVDAVASVPVDLILVEDCSPGLRASIQRDGLSV
jgi:predicted nucleotidyltransferase